MTAHVNFTQVATAALDNDLELLGYCHQAAFLISLGLTDLATPSPTPEGQHVLEGQHVPENQCASEWAIAQQIKQLTLPSEMGELFKVMALGKDVAPLQGFTLMNQRERLFTYANHHH